MKIKFKKVHEYATIPKRAHSSDAGFDLTMVKYEYSGNNVSTIHTGIAVDIPEGYVGLLFPRSSVYNTSMRMSNSVGVIDAGYRGEIMAKVDLIENTKPIYKLGERCLQLVILKLPNIELEEVDMFKDRSERGENGYGSTGK